MVGKLPLPLFGMNPTFPFDDRYRPVFASIAVDGVSGLRGLTPAAIEQLRRCAPVGCADWDTYYLMRALDVPAFQAEDASDCLGSLVTRIIAGDSEQAVYDAWQAACAQAVSKSLARDRDYTEPLPIELDIQEVCRAIRAKEVVVERSEPAGNGPEINVEFSLDGNIKHQMVVCLDSIVRRASRPIRLFVMCRDHDGADFARLAALFPTVSFVWLPTDEVDHGDLAAMISHITMAAPRAARRRRADHPPRHRHGLPRRYRRAGRPRPRRSSDRGGLLNQMALPERIQRAARDGVPAACARPAGFRRRAHRAHSSAPPVRLRCLQRRRHGVRPEADARRPVLPGVLPVRRAV
jgi:hypothetical protein